MKLGVDFGTNRTVIAAADRGNYPLVSFQSPDGSIADWFPSLVAVRGTERLYGWDAWNTQGDNSWTVVRSIKRLLEDAGPQTLLDLGERQVSLADLLTGLTTAIAAGLRECSNLSLEPGEPLDIVLGVPAHANSNQRFLTVEAFRNAGFNVLSVLNEPSAASIEFGHRERRDRADSATLLVYDLGGGTFDASLVRLDENVHHVVASEGIPTIGGDDFDQILADLALDAAGIEADARDKISAAAWFRLLDECRIKKEALNPNSRKIVVDLDQVNPDWNSAQVTVSSFYEAARPLVEETLSVAEDLVSRQQDDQFEVLYITGGGSELPLVSRVLRERFGRRVRRSTFTRSATAIGLAIQADQPETYRLTERLFRYFGVWREADNGSRVTFDPLFSKGTQLPAVGEPKLQIRRRYTPVHNIGHFRFLECTHRTESGTPSGEITVWDDIRYPFDPDLASCKDLVTVPVTNSHQFPQHIEELYECDASGSIAVSISNHSAAYSRSYPLGHWSQDSKPIKQSRRRKKS